MKIMPTYIYTLEQVAKIEGVTPDYMRIMLFRKKKASKPLEWRSYRFQQGGDAKGWIAIPKDSDIEFFKD